MANKIRERVNLFGVRIVNGSPTTMSTTDPQGRTKDKPNWYLHIAAPKHPSGNGPVEQVLNTAFNVSMNGYAGNQQIQQRIQEGPNGSFRFKIEDGDSPKNRGKEGHAGCWIFKLSTTFGAMKCIDINNNEMDPAVVKCGHGVDVSFFIEPNGNVDNTAGIYLNPEFIRLTTLLPEIRTGASPTEAFGGTKGQPIQGGQPYTAGGSGGGGFGGQQRQLEGPNQNNGGVNWNGNNNNQGNNNGGNWQNQNNQGNNNQGNGNQNFQNNNNNNNNQNNNQGNNNGNWSNNQNNGQNNQGQNNGGNWGNGGPANGQGVPEGATGGPAGFTNQNGSQENAFPSNNNNQNQNNDYASGYPGANRHNGFGN